MKRFKKILWIYIRFVQKILITIFLSITYFVVIPFSWLFIIFFKPKYIFNKFEIKESYWNTIKPIQNSISEYKEQS
jgi:hypothetical protein